MLIGNNELLHGFYETFMGKLYRLEIRKCLKISFTETLVNALKSLKSDIFD